MSALIGLESVSKRYGPRTVVHDVSFTVEKGEIVGFLGPNGAGKTTTMRMIAGVITASSGRVTVAGFDMATQNEEAARRIGYVPEHPPLYDALDVSSYLRFVAKVKGVPRAAISSELDRVTSACHLEDVFRKEVYKLSKGYRQRLGLAQALVGKPDVRAVARGPASKRATRCRVACEWTHDEGSTQRTPASSAASSSFSSPRNPPLWCAHSRA